MFKKLELYFKNFLLQLLIKFAKKNSSSQSLKINSSTKCLLIRLNRIGDALITTPFIHQLKQKTNCKIYLLADKKNYFVFNNNQEIDKVFIFKKGVINFIKMIKELNSMEFDVVIDLHDDVSTTVSTLISLIKSRFTVGLEKSNKSIFSHIIRKPESTKVHIVERICSLLKIFNISYHSNELQIHYKPASESILKFDKFLSQRFNEKKFLLGVNISAGSKARFWGIENYKKLIENLRKYDINIILMSNNKEFSEAKKIINENYILKTINDFDLFSAGIQKLNLLISPDTSAIHIATANKIPVFGLYVNYNTNDMIWSPYNSDFECVITKEPNLWNMEFNSVWEKLKPFFEKHFYLYKNNFVINN